MAVHAVSSPAVNGPGATTLIGTGAAGFSGDGSTARSTELDGPLGIATDSSGDVFIADSGNCRIREIPAKNGNQYTMSMSVGRAYTIAGGPCGASSSDASVGFVASVAADSSGDVFVANPTSDVIVELRVGTKSLEVVAGDGEEGDTGDGGPATTAELDQPQGVSVDARGNLYVADTENCKVREIAQANGKQWGIPMHKGDIYTVAGTGGCGEAGDGGPRARAELWNPVDVVMGPRGDLLISDSGGEEILDLASEAGDYYGIHIGAGHLSAVVGFGFYGGYLIDGLPATGETAELNSPAGITVDTAGDIFISDTYSYCIREVPAADSTQRGSKVTEGDMYTVAGALPTNLGNSTQWVGSQMLYPTGIALASNGAVIYADQGANVVREIPSH
jgi:hypothetical protein